MFTIKKGNNRKVSGINQGPVDCVHILTSVDFKFINFRHHEVIPEAAIFLNILSYFVSRCVVQNIHPHII